MKSSLIVRAKRHPTVRRVVFRTLWIARLLIRPYTGLFTAYYLLRLRKCGTPVDFSTTMIIRNPGNIVIGAGCSFSNHVILDAHDRIEIGSNCMLANQVVVATATHDYSLEQMNTRVITKPVVIGDNVWLGIGATVLPGVRIGSGTVIGAKSLVTRDIPANSIAYGVPARVVRSRSAPAGHDPR
ncbi:MAG TPA: acyltransferase [Burkholderiales bacterium]|nr:acyltransferase [Burkholderiales bacterium]